MNSIRYIYAFLALGLFTDCSTKTTDGDLTQATGRTELITLSQQQKQQAGIQLGALEDREMSDIVVTNGYFDVPPQNKAQISSFKAGYVKSTSLLVGDHVKKGQAVVVLENPEYVKAQQSYMEVKVQLEYLKAEYERKKVLEQEKITAQKNLQKAQADYQSALARFQGLKKELQLMGINLSKLEAGQYTTTMSIRAPIGGTVTKVGTTIGKYVLPQEVLLEMVNTDHMHVELEVFEKDVTKVREGQSIRLRIPNLSDKLYKGEVYLVGKALDPETRSIHVHGHIPEEERFVPGMYVEAEIVVASKMVPALPEQAVWTDGEEAYIFTEIPADGEKVAFRKVRVETGLVSDGWIEVIPQTKLTDGTKVVYEGAYYLSSSSGG